jgi:hypothetical protein
LLAQLDSLLYLMGRAELVVNALLNQNRFERGEPKHDSRRAPAREHSDENLSLKESERFIFI